MNSGAPPNTNVCPVCLGLPGVLPVANEEALRLTALTGYLLNCTVARSAKFDRKNYFYPDMPKNYQITQYDQPSTVNGYVDFEFGGGLARVRITCAPGGGRGQEFSFRAPERRRFQPGRRAPAGDCLRTRPHRRGHGLRILERPERHPDLWRRERLRHGERHGAL